jgi:hypothetical protein
MSVIFALVLAAGSTAATTDSTSPKKPRMRCEWIHEVGTSRPRRVCEKAQPKAKEAQPPVPAQQTGEPKQNVSPNE